MCVTIICENAVYVVVTIASRRVKYNITSETAWNKNENENKRDR